jgi:hypothetical protein
LNDIAAMRAVVKSFTILIKPDAILATMDAIQAKIDRIGSIECSTRYKLA